MTKYFGMNLKSLLTNPNLIFWSILFIEFWVFLWAFVFSSYVPSTEEAVRVTIATAYGNLLMLSLSGGAISIASSLVYSSKSIRYVTKYTRLSASRFLLENLSSSLVVLLVISGIMFVSVLGVFFAKFGIFILPKDPIWLSFSVILSVLFIYVFALFLNAVVVVLRVPRATSFIIFVPWILAFTAYSALWVDFKNAVYFSPFNSIVSICYFFLSGERPPTGNFFALGEKTLVNIDLALLSLVLWLVVFVVLDVFLLRKMRGVGVEEIRIT